MENPQQPLDTQPPKQAEKQHKTSFFEKYGSKKWLLPLLGFLVLLLLSLGIYGVLGSQNTNRDPQSRQERREQRQERKEKRKEKRNNNESKKERKNSRQKKDKKKAKANANAGWTNFSYSNGNNQIRMKYPGDLKVNITDGKSIINPSVASPLVTFTGQLHNIKMTFEPNPNSLTLAAWHEQLKKLNTIYSKPTETILVAGRQSYLQHTLGTTVNWHAFVPVDNKTVLWINMNYGGSDDDAKVLFTELLKSLNIGSKPKGLLPTIVTN